MKLLIYTGLMCCCASVIAQTKVGTPTITNTNAINTPADARKLKMGNQVLILSDDLVVIPADSITGLYENSCKVTFFQPLRLPVADNQNNIRQTRFAYNGTFHVQTGQDRPGRFVGRQFNFQVTDDKIGVQLNSQLLYNTSLNSLINTQVDYSGTDNHIIKLKDGGLMALRMAITRRDIANKPAWWGVEKMVTDVGNLFIDQPNQRGATLFFLYNDKTKAWQQTNYIFDAANTLNGDYGVPRIANDANDKPQFSTYYIGGNDRPEFYQDPWTGRLYMTMWGAGGVDPNTKKGAVKPADQPKIADFKFGTFTVYSDNLGASWNLLERLDNLLVVPMMMTSTREGRLFLAHEYNMTGADAAMVIRYTLKNNPAKLCSPIVIDKHSDQYLVQTDTMAYMMDKHLIPQLTICRAGSPAGKSVIRIAYNVVEKASGRQFIKTGTLTVNSDADGDYEYTPGTIIKPGDGVSSAIYPTFIEADPDNKGGATDVSALYWIESTRSNAANIKEKGNGTSAKSFSTAYAVFGSTGQLMHRGYLSTSGGKKREWTGNYISQGDYFTGGFFQAAGRLNFVAQWSEPEGIKANIISVLPDSKTTQAVHPIIPAKPVQSLPPARPVLRGG